MTHLTLNRNEIHAKELRAKRAPLLDAWDIAKGNIILGIDTVSPERMADLITWYRAILELDEKALDTVPEEIKKYLKKEAQK